MMEYKCERVDQHGYIITEEGHTMFPEDVKARLDRLNFLELEKRKTEPRLALMREMADLIKIVISDDIYGDNRLGKEFKSILTRYKEMTKS